MWSLPWGLWAEGGEAQPRVLRLYQNRFPEGQEAVKHSTTHQPQPTDLKMIYTWWFSCVLTVTEAGRAKHRLDHNKSFFLFPLKSFFRGYVRLHDYKGRLYEAPAVRGSARRDKLPSGACDIVCEVLIVIKHTWYFHQWNPSVSDQMKRSFWPMSRQKLHQVMRSPLTKLHLGGPRIN